MILCSYVVYGLSPVAVVFSAIHSKEILTQCIRVRQGLDRTDTAEVLNVNFECQLRITIIFDIPID